MVKATTSTDYSRTWSSSHPGCLIFLLDLSGSMLVDFGGQAAEKQSKIEVLAASLNRVINEVITENTKEGVIFDRVDVAILGYNGTTANSLLPAKLTGRDFAKLTELRQNPLRIDPIEQEIITPKGEIRKEVEYYNVWVNPDADGGTPMKLATGQARDLAARWTAQHPDNFPPVVVHITDGESSDGDPSDDFKTLREVSTTDGALLLFNCHITDSGLLPVEFPSDASMLTTVLFAEMLFEGSSEIPPNAKMAFAEATGRQLEHGARGYIFNGNANSIRKMLRFGSTVGKAAPGINGDR